MATLVQPNLMAAGSGGPGKYLNPWKMYVAGIWMSKVGKDVSEILGRLGFPPIQHAYVIKGEVLDSIMS